MKKVALFIISLLLIIPFTVKALDPSVTNVNADVNGSTINYAGTAEDGVIAVMCKLYDSNNNELDKFSIAVSENAFSGTFEVESNGEYKVSCARFEGGAVKSATVTVAGASTVTTTTTANVAQTSKNPKTNDGILNYVYILVVGVIGMIFGALYIRKTKKLKSK